MNKGQSDTTKINLSSEARSRYSRILDEMREVLKTSPLGTVSLKELWEPQRNGAPLDTRNAVDAVVARDEMGPKVGEPAVDFFLKRMGSNERVRLSSFRGKRSVALVFGSYT